MYMCVYTLEDWLCFMPLLNNAANLLHSFGFVTNPITLYYSCHPFCSEVHHVLMIQEAFKMETGIPVLQVLLSGIIP